MKQYGYNVFEPTIIKDGGYSIPLEELNIIADNPAPFVLIPDLGVFAPISKVRDGTGNIAYLTAIFATAIGEIAINTVLVNMETGNVTVKSMSVDE